MCAEAECIARKYSHIGLTPSSLGLDTSLVSCSQRICLETPMPSRARPGSRQ